MSTLHWLKRHSSLLEAIPSAELRAAEKDVLLYIARQSVGYRREDTRHYVSEAVLARKTGRAPSTISAALSRLKQLKVIQCVKKGRATRHPNSWSIQNPAKWKCAWRGDTPPAGEWSTTPVERGSTTPPQRVHRHSKNLNKNQTPPPPRGAAEYWQQHGDILLQETPYLQRSLQSFQAAAELRDLPDPSPYVSELIGLIEATGRKLT